MLAEVQDELLNRSYLAGPQLIVPGWTPTEASVSDLQNLSRPFVIGISIQIGPGVSNMFPPPSEIHFSQFPKLCIKVQEGRRDSGCKTSSCTFCADMEMFLKSRKVKID